jgi:class 3 adenylate cyclase/DNA-binding winged helix-turn-helix (wHTH) protein/tetratricopeptide (TPR) repeat protein
MDQAQGRPHATYRFDRFALDLGRGALLAADGAEVPLRPKSFALLRLLVENAGALLDRNAMAAAVWPGLFVSDESIAQCVKDVRRALGDEAQRLVRTVRKRGYILDAEVSRGGPPPRAAHAPRRTPPGGPPPMPPQRPDPGADGGQDRLPGGAETEVGGLLHGRGLERAEAAFAVDPRHGGIGTRTPGDRQDSCRRTGEAERRQITVLFCDLAGSTALSSRLDPEDLRDVLAAYQRRVAGVVGRWAGCVANRMGDGVLAYFGHPEAHEDDAERATRAGLELVDAVGGLEPRDGSPLRVRVGIATGPVVIGDVAGSGDGRERVAVGETPNLAARLQAVAEPGAVVVSSSTRRLVAGLFDFADLGAREAEGSAAPVRAWRALGPSRAADRFEARHAGARPTPLVGREEELALLLGRWGRALGGEGQAVLLAGEPGIGKSRLVRALRDRLGGTAHVSLSCQCSPHHTDTALRPVVGQLERAAGLLPGEAAGAKLAKLESLLGQADVDVAAAAPLFADLLGVQDCGRYPPLDLTPRRRREELFRALLDQLAGLAAKRPVLQVFEDVHWSDPTTAELLGLVVERVRDLPVLVLATSRPGSAPPWAGHAHATLLTVGRLGGREAAAMVDRVAGRRLPAGLVAQIAAKADGVPLFVEELARAALERTGPAPAGPAGAPPPAPAVPATLQDSLMARLDRAPAAREVAQVAAVIGREFRHDLLAAVARVTGDRLEDALARLADAGLVFRRGVPPAVRYAFKHALVRDAAYGTLLKGKRRELHARVARALEERFPGTAEKEPELLAHHCARAGLADRAATYHLLAGQRAIARSALAEAVSQLGAGLYALSGIPDGPGRRRRELDLQLALATALIAAKGYAAAETGRTLARARGLCREEDGPHQLFAVLNGQVLLHSQRGEPRATHEVAAEMLERARREGGDPALLVPAHRAMGLASWHLGRFGAMREHAERVLALCGPEGHRSAAWLYPADLRIGALAHLCVALFVLGHPDQASARVREMLRAARDLGHPASLAQALLYAGILHFAARDMPALRLTAEAEITTAAEHGLPHFLGLGRVHRGIALIGSGQGEAGIADIERGKAALEAAGSRLLLNVGDLVASAHARAGRHEEASRHAREARAWTEGSPPSFSFQAEELRRHGDLLLSLPGSDRAEAEACFRRAVEVARAQGARMWELRAAVSLAKLWSGRGRRRDVRELLAPVYGRFTEGFDAPDLQDAEALLGEQGEALAGEASACGVSSASTK